MREAGFYWVRDTSIWVVAYWGPRGTVGGFMGMMGISATRILRR